MKYSFPSLAFALCCVILCLLTSCSHERATRTVLVLATSDHFGLFTGEILRTEGFNHFTLDSISGKSLSEQFLRGFDIVILAQTDLTDAHAQTLTQFVREGGHLVAFKPDTRLAEVFGLKSIKPSEEEGYIAIVDDTAIGKGLIRDPLKNHAGTDVYEPETATVVAWFYSSRTQTAGRPAVVVNTFGKGRAMAFAYNLPESIVRTRQGNPESAGQEKDGILGIRAMDLFTDGFVDTTQNTLNPADEQMRLLSHGIEHMSSKPMPRFWYFPDSLKCVVTLNNDGEDSKEEEFLKQFNDVAARGASMTLYVKEPQLISPERVRSWRNDGFEISGHPDDTRQATHPDWNTMDSVYGVLGERLRTMYNVPSMKTITNHWFVWVGSNADGTINFAAQAEIESLHGVELDCNYAHYDNGSPQGHFLGAMGSNQGNYTGTGLTMKFANSSGKILNIYQQLNNVYDQQYMEHDDKDGYFNAFRGLMDRSLHDEVYSSISVRAHNNEYFFSEVPLMKMLDYAKDHNIPVWNEVTWLAFLQAKDEATFDDIQWSGDVLKFTVQSSKSFQRSLSVLVPAMADGKRAGTLSLDGVRQTLNVVSIKGFDYARILVKPGMNHEAEIQYLSR